jgi:hypothetical protein
MIFLSHNHRDKGLVEDIALTLSHTFGMEKVFYDSWSIQPGDGIIDRMNEGLGNCKFFIFFVSKNSISSNFVKLEWQNALMRVMQSDCKFIPVKLDDCQIPPMLLQALYLSLPSLGPKQVARQIIDVINGNNTFTPISTPPNVTLRIISKSNNKIEIEIKANYYVEPLVKLMFLCSRECNNFSVSLPSESSHINWPVSEIKTDDGAIHNAYRIELQRALSVGFPLRATLESSDAPLEFRGVLIAKSEDRYEEITLSQ